MLLKMFCKHKWKTLVMAESPKVAIPSTGFKCSEYLFEKMLWGSKNIIISCEKCGKIIQKEVLGDENE